MRLLTRVLVLMMFLTISCEKEKPLELEYPFIGEYGLNILNVDVNSILPDRSYSLYVKTNAEVKIEFSRRSKLWDLPFYNTDNWTEENNVFITKGDADCSVLFNYGDELRLRFYINGKFTREKIIYFDI